MTAVAAGSHEPITVREAPNIVKPPADFADSPESAKCTQSPSSTNTLQQPSSLSTTQHGNRLYKKLDKRFRSEERHGERKHYRYRQESTRAKVYIYNF